MKQKVLGVIGVLWGGAVLFRHFHQGGGIDLSSAYAAGQSTGLIIGVLMFVAGVSALVRR
jgi:hypothetical protein